MLKSEKSRLFVLLAFFLLLLLGANIYEHGFFWGFAKTAIILALGVIIIFVVIPWAQKGN